jgi:hypothetical protein
MGYPQMELLYKEAGLPQVEFLDGFYREDGLSWMESSLKPRTGAMDRMCP